MGAPNGSARSLVSFCELHQNGMDYFGAIFGQVLILYRVHLADIVRKDPSRTRHHEILQFYSQLRKGRGMCVVAAVLEGDRASEKMLKKAQIEKDIITSIMKQNEILGFAEVVVAPNWGEGANYILQLTGVSPENVTENFH